jgi:hypothetical protein
LQASCQKGRITGRKRKRLKSHRPKYWITDRMKLEIKNIEITCGNFKKYLSVWNKIILGYALEIWNEIIRRFPKYDWILYKNKRLKHVDLNLCISVYRDYGIFYLKILLKLSGKELHFDVET